MWPRLFLSSKKMKRCHPSNWPRLSSRLMTKPASRRAFGFTLIELLVVISLITLLISLLLPSLGKAKEAARQSECLSNIRQIGVAWQSYTTESLGGIPDYTLQRPDRKIWTTVFKPYYGDNHKVLICPSTENPLGNAGLGNISIPGVRMGNAKLAWIEARPSYNAPDPFNRSSYTYNVNMFAKASYNVQENRYEKTTQIVNPDLTPILGDGDWRSATPGVPGTTKRFPPNLSDPLSSALPTDDAVFRWVTNRHGNASQMVFADSHAAAVPLPNMWSLQWHRNYVKVSTLP